MTNKAEAPRSTVSSIEARRILAVLEDCRHRIEYALMLPTLGDFLEGRENVDEEIQIAHADFSTHQHAIGSMITADGEPKAGRNVELEEETAVFKDSARDLIRVMMKHSDFFVPLLQQSGNVGGNTATLLMTMKDLNELQNLSFTTPVETDEKQKRMMQEIQQRRKSNHDHIEQLNSQLAALTRERDLKVRTKEDILDDLKQQFQQAQASEAALQQDDLTTDEMSTQEETQKLGLMEEKNKLQKQQKENSDEEGKIRRTCRKEEEALQALIHQYDTEMADLSGKIDAAKTDVAEKEKLLHELQAQYDDLEKQRTPLRHEESGIVERTNQANKMNQDIVAASTLLKLHIRKYLETAPKPQKKKKKSSKK